MYTGKAGAGGLEGASSPLGGATNKSRVCLKAKTTSPRKGSHVHFHSHGSGQDALFWHLVTPVEIRVCCTTLGPHSGHGVREALTPGLAPSTCLLVHLLISFPF